MKYDLIQSRVDTPESLGRQFGCRQSHVSQLTALTEELLDTPGHLPHLSKHKWKSWFRYIVVLITSVFCIYSDNQHRM